MAFKTTETRYEAGDSRLVPAYSVAEAAHYLRMPEETLRSWVVGRCTRRWTVETVPTA